MPTTPFDCRQNIYSNRTYIRTMYSLTTRRFCHPPSSALPSINGHDFLLSETKLAADVGSAASSSCINSLEHYDNTYIHTYDNPIECFERCNAKESLLHLPEGHGYLADNIKAKKIADDNVKYGSSTSPHSVSPILFYLENKRLGLVSCMICFLLLLVFGIGIFLLYKLLRPVVITTTVNNHYDLMNTSAIPITPHSTILPALLWVLTQPTTTPRPTTTSDGSPLSNGMCPPDRWGINCQNICKPCGLGICHPVTGICICPEDIYGEYCDLSKVNDKPKRGDMTS